MALPNISIAQLILGDFGTNCYLVVDNVSGDGLVIDPAVYDERIGETLAEMGMDSLRYIMLTHGHEDHILGVNGLREQYPGAQVIGTEGDAKFFTDPTLSLAERFGKKQDPIYLDRIVYGGDEVDFAGSKIQVLATPGHTLGSSCFILGNIRFSGDTLFRGSMGVTTHPTGDAEAEYASLQRLKALPGNYNVLPGHGPLTTLQQERETNPYMREREE